MNGAILIHVMTGLLIAITMMLNIIIVSYKVIVTMLMIILENYNTMLMKLVIMQIVKLET